MKQDLIISVIVPVYNGEKFVRRAVESILCQMDGRIELILVDDGSTDASAGICDEYAQKHPQIHVIHKANGGTSSAKNMAIEVAEGQYLSFMDCDDYLDEHTYSQIIPLLQEYQPDCLDFGYRYVDIQGNKTEMLHQCEKNTLLSREELETVILPPLLNLRKDDAHFVFDFCCTKIFRAEIVKKHQVRFDEEKRTWEDRTFILRHLKHCQNYYAMDRCFYNYVYTPNSLSQRYRADLLNIIIANFRHYRELFGDQFDFDTQYCNDYWAQAMENMIIRFLEEKKDRQLIRHNILAALQNEQVIHWFTNRKTNGSFQQTVQRLIVSGSFEKVLECYEKEVRRKRRQRLRSDMKNRIRRCVKKLLKGDMIALKGRTL